MRKIKYLSPSSLACYEKDPKEFYIRYLADAKTPRPTQTKPMSVGSAFDAYVKSYLYKELMGVSTGFDFEELFEKQVEEPNRYFARAAGLHCFEQYQASGVLIDVLKLLESGSEVEFEIEVIRGISRSDSPLVITKEWDTLPESTIPVLGKPDLRFRLSCGTLVTLDWKVNGYCSKSGAATKRGYVKFTDVGILGKNHGTRHRDCIIGNGCKSDVDSFAINIAEPFENYYEQHADQLCTYSWNNGAKVGEPAIVCIHQLAWKTGHLAVVDYRGMISQSYQEHLFDRYKNLWDVIEGGFLVLSFEERELLEKIAAQAAENPDSDFEKMFIDMTRGY